jgi:hypothetical protein
MAIGDPFYDKTVLILRGDSFVDLSAANNKISAVGSTSIVGGFGSNTQTSSAILTGNVNATSTDLSSVYVLGPTLDSIGLGNFTLEMSVYITSANAIPTLLSWGIRQPVANVNSFMLAWGLSPSGHISVESILGTTIDTYCSISFAFTLNTWYHITLIRTAGVLAAYNGSTLLGTNNTNTTLQFSNTTNMGLSVFSSRHATSANNYGVTGYLGGLRITKAARPAPTTPSFALFSTYAAQISGTIAESQPITNWTITGVSSTGLTCSTTTTGTTYTLNCPSLEPYSVTCSPTVNGKWIASTSISLGYFIVPSNPNNNPALYTCTVAGTTGTTEPAFTGTTYTDGSATWVRVGYLVDPISLGCKVPS